MKEEQGLSLLPELPDALLPTDWQLDIDAPDALVQEIAEPEENAHSVTVSSSVEESAPPPLGRILEALFFAAQEPLSADRLSKIIRGLTPPLLETAVTELNQRYRQQGRAYCIVPQKTGYRLMLRTSFRPLLEQLYGGIKEARFSQLAIETLAIVGYCQPVTEPNIEIILGQGCSSVLRQLVRRGMVQLQSSIEPDERKYITTSRFLDFFQLSKVEDLPRADDLERL